MPGRRERNLKILLAASVLVPFVLLVVFSVHDRQAVLDAADERVRRKADILEEHVARVLETYVKVLDIAELASAGLNGGALNSEALHLALKRHAGTSPALSSVAITDGSGQVQIGSLERQVPRGNVADRNYFRSATSENGIIIGDALTSRASEGTVFMLARRRAAPDDGVIFVSLFTSYFQQVFARVAGEDGGGAAAALVRADGSILARQPALTAPLSLGPNTGLMRAIARAPSGEFRSVAQIDGRERLYAYRRIGAFPLYLSYGLELEAALAPWRKGLIYNAVVAAVAAALLAAVTLLAQAHARRDRQQGEHLGQLVTERTLEAERRAAEADMARLAAERARLEAERANAAKSHFLAAASHDLRQPVQALRLFHDVLRGQLASDRDRRVLQQAALALAGLEELLAALLDVSVLEAGMVRPRLEPVAVAALLDRIVREFEDQARRKGLHLRAVSTGLAVHSDPVLLHRLLRNLVANAIKFTRRGGVVIGCRRRSGAVVIEVWDSGIGIPADKIDAVFDDFVQIGNPARDRREGLGLGLGVVRRMAALLGHDLGLRSVPGRGSVFQVMAGPAVTPAARQSRAAAIAR